MMHIKNVSIAGRLNNITLKAPLKQQIHIIGPNGSGKSTLLAVLAGIMPFKGQVLIGDMDISSISLKELSKIRAYLAQNEKPVFNITVHEYLRLSLPSHINLNPNIVTDVVNHLVELLNVRDKLTSSIHQLSGGEWQRVRIVGCCLQVWPELNPDGRLLILDEPTAPLDIGQEKYLYQLLTKAVDEGLSIVMANHDLNRTLRHADQAILLSDAQVFEYGELNRVVNVDNIRSVFQTDVKQIENESKKYLIFD